MKLFKIKSKSLFISLVIIYIVLIVSLIMPVSGYKMDLPGNISPIAEEVKIEGLKSNQEFYSIYIYSYRRPTLFQMLIGSLTDRVEVYKDNSLLSSSLDYFRGALLEELSFQYAIINAYNEAKKTDPNISIAYELNSYVITYSVNSDISIGARFTHVDGMHIESFTDEDLKAYFKDNNSLILTVLDLENETTNDLLLKKTNGLYGIVYDKYFVINNTSPKYETFYDKDNKVGPSGGLLQTLEIYSILISKKHNMVISGTGTIDANGNVGSIGGVKQKIYTANKKVDIFFVPEENYQEALKAYNKIKKPTFKLVKVSDFSEAVQELFS